MIRAELLLAAIAGFASAGALRESGLSLRDAQNRNRLQISALEGDGSAVWFFDDQNAFRLSAGIYAEDPANPVVAFAPPGGGSAVKLLLRLAGNQSPVIVVKDKPNSDRIVMGLDMGGLDEEPFLVYHTQGGQKAVFGHF
jgi:hypothetical protein